MSSCTQGSLCSWRLRSGTARVLPFNNRKYFQNSVAAKMQLTREDVQKVAALARLEFSSAELDDFTEQLGKIVTFVEQLDEVATEGVQPLAHPLEIHSALRRDECRAGLSRAAALANSPNHDDECFLVPPVMARG